MTVGPRKQKGGVAEAVWAIDTWHTVFCVVLWLQLALCFQHLQTDYIDLIL